MDRLVDEISVAWPFSLNRGVIAQPKHSEDAGSEIAELVSSNGSLNLFHTSCYCPHSLASVPEHVAIAFMNHATTMHPSISGSGDSRGRPLVRRSAPITPGVVSDWRRRSERTDCGLPGGFGLELMHGWSGGRWRSGRTRGMIMEIPGRGMGDGDGMQGSRSLGSVLGSVDLAGGLQPSAEVGLETYPLMAMYRFMLDFPTGAIKGECDSKAPIWCHCWCWRTE